MDQSAQEDLEALRRTDPEVDSLLREHRSLDEKVSGLTSKSFLTQEEDLELHRLKKEKLRLKDKIEAVIQQKKSACQDLILAPEMALPPFRAPLS